MPFNPQNQSQPSDENPDEGDFTETIANNFPTGKTIAGASNLNRTRKAAGNPSLNPSITDRLIGSVVAERYKILNILGRGGMSTVYRAEHLLTKKIVALKVMHAHLLDDAASVRRFQQEATAASRLTHPNAIQVHDLGMIENGMPFLTMDYLEGVSLSELIDSPHHRLDVLQSLDIFIQACDAIQEAHEHGIIHRDIKPSNIMLVRGHKSKDKEDTVKVLDFGIAKVTQENSEGPKLTGTGEIFGSPVYMSPEQCLGKELDVRSDIYSMGCLMYEVLCGKPPLLGKTVLATMYLQMNQMPRGLSKINADPRFVKDLEQIVLKCLEKDPDKRFRTMAELKDTLIVLRDKKQSGLPLFANVAMGASDLMRSASNKLGPSKRLILVMVAVLFIGTITSLIFLSGGLLQKAPVLSERYISYATEGHISPSIKNFDKTTQDEMLVEQSRAWSDNLLSDGRNESNFYLEKAFAEKLMFKHNYPQASDRFNRAMISIAGSKRSPLLDVAQVLGELGYCRLQQEQYQLAKNDALHCVKIFNYIDVCSDLESVNAFATIGNALEKLQKSELAMGAYTLYAGWWDTFHDKLKERDPNRCAISAVQAADFLAKAPFDYRTRENAIIDVRNMISQMVSPALPKDVRFSPTERVQSALKKSTSYPEKAAEDFYDYGIGIFDSQGTRSAYNAGAAYNNLALLKIRQGKITEALSCLKKAERSLKLSEDSQDKSLALVKFSESDCEWHLHQYQQALESAWTARTQWSSSKNSNRH